MGMTRHFKTTNVFLLKKKNQSSVLEFHPKVHKVLNKVTNTAFVKNVINLCIYLKLLFTMFCTYLSVYMYMHHVDKSAPLDQMKPSDLMELEL